MIRVAARGTSANRPEGRRRAGFLLILTASATFLLLSITAAVMIGPVGIRPSVVWQVVLDHLGLWTGTVPEAAQFIVWDIRLPRVLLASVVGAGLAVVGALLQALVRNPLADPYVFGITSGASVGASALVVTGVAVFGSGQVAGAAFLGAVVSFLLVVGLARAGGGLSPARLILAGLSIAYALSALTSLLVFLASVAGDSSIATSVLFWLLGGLGGATWAHLGLPALVMVLGTGFVLLKATALNALLLGEETAATLGTEVARLRLQLLALAALVTGVMVAVSGGIGFVGLMVPHAVRMAVGPDHRRLLPLSALVGAIFLIWADVLARTVAAPQELPIGVVTALFGTPFFVTVMRTMGRRSQVGAR